MTSSLTPAQTATALTVSPSTLRRWSTVLAAQLSPSANPPKGKKRSYTGEDLAVLRRAADLIRAGRSPEDVVTLLTIAPDPAAAPTGLEVATLPTLARDLVKAREVIRILADEVRAARDAATQTAAALQETQAKVDALDARLKAWEGLSFVDRLLGRKPKP